MEIAHLIGRIIVGGFFLIFFLAFSAFESDGFEKIPWATITVIVLITGVFLSTI